MKTNFLTLLPQLAKLPKQHEQRQAPGAGQDPSRTEALAQALVHCSTPEARELILFADAVKLRALPLSLLTLCGEEVLSVAVAEDFDTQTIQALRFTSGREIKPTIVEQNSLDLAIFKAYRGCDSLVATSAEKLKAAERKGGTVEDFAALPEAKGEVATFLQALLEYSAANRASDIHIVPRSDGSHIRLRIDGQLRAHEQPLCSAATHNQIINRVKVLGQLDHSKKNQIQDGAFRCEFPGMSLNVRVAIMPTIHGEKVTMRLVGGQTALELNELGFDPITLSRITDYLSRSEGALLVAGPTGSGKSTTLYALSETLARRGLNVVTIEDPVERSIPGVSQTTLREEIGLTFEKCIRGALRQDPDAMMIGEIRDRGSANAVFQAALTGHLVLSTVHARDPFEVLLRLRSLEVDSLTISQALELIVCQRLIPALCQHCKVYDLRGSDTVQAEIYKAVGCKRCDYAGFQGRVLAHDCLKMDRGLALAIVEGSDLGGIGLKIDRRVEAFKNSLEYLLRQGKIELRQYLELVNCDEFKTSPSA